MTRNEVPTSGQEFLGKTLEEFLNILGIDRSVAAKIEENITDDHWSEEELLKQFFRAKLDSFDKQVSPKELYDHLGLDVYSKVVIKWLEDNECHYTAEEKLMYFIESFYDSRETIPEWAKPEYSGQEVTTTRCWSSSPSKSTITFRPVHIPGEKSSDDVDGLVLAALSKNAGPKTDGKKHWFHITSLRSAQSILSNGIVLQRGKARANFSNEDGFYLSDKVAESTRRLCRHKYNHNEYLACFVFSFDDDDAYPLKIFPGFNLTDKSQEERLRKISSYFRNVDFPCDETNLERDGLDPDYRQTLEFIEGPLCSFKRKNWRPSDVIIDRSLTQLCIRGQRIKNVFEQAMQKDFFLVEVSKLIEDTKEIDPVA